MDGVLPKRKHLRLKEYDYSQNGAYFVTICTKNRANVLWEAVGTGIARPPWLSQYGNVVEKAIRNIPFCYTGVSVDNYAVMPNHVHLLLRIEADENGRAMPVPTISTIIQQTKGYVTKQIGRSIWQSRFHDHVVRNQVDYDDIYRYIENNPTQWELDELYTDQ